MDKTLQSFKVAKVRMRSESIEQLAHKEVCVTVHLLLTATRRKPAVRASRHTVRASWLVSQ